MVEKKINIYSHNSRLKRPDSPVTSREREKDKKIKLKKKKTLTPMTLLLSVTLPATYQMQGELNPFTRTHHGVVDKVPHSGGGGGGPLGHEGAPGGF